MTLESFFFFLDSLEVNSNEIPDGTLPILYVDTLGHALHMFINKQYIGKVFFDFLTSRLAHIHTTEYLE